MKLERLVEGWATLSASRWSSAGASVAGGVLSIVQTESTQPGTSFGHYANSYVETTGTYDLTESEIVVEIVQRAGIGQTGTNETRLLVHFGNPDGPVLFIEIDSTKLQAGYRLAPSTTQGTAARLVAAPLYSAGPHRYWRIAERDGVIEWAVSADLFDWSTLGLLPVPAALLPYLSGARLRLEAGWYNGLETSPGTLPPAKFAALNPSLGMPNDPLTEITADAYAPNLAVDVRPDVLPGTFIVGDSLVGGDALLGWGTGADGWSNIVCDVQEVRTSRGATRLQGALTRTEAGSGSVSLIDTDRRFDPTVNADAIHAGTPVRVRVWAPEQFDGWDLYRTNLVPNPRLAVGVNGWSRNSGTGGATTGTRQTAAVSPVGTTAYRVTWTTATTAVGGGPNLGSSAAGTYEIPVVGGSSYYVSAYARCSKVQRVGIGVVSYNAAGAQVGSSVVTAVVLAANISTRLGTAVVVPATAVRVIVTVYSLAGASGTVWAVNDWLEVTGVLAELAGTQVAGDYFDGDTAATGAAVDDVRHEWTGAASSSASAEYIGVGARYWSEVLMSGRIGEDVSVVYQQTGAPLVSFVAVDVVTPLSQYAGIGNDPPLGAGDVLIDRVQRVVAEIGRVPATVDVDSDAVWAVTMPPTALTRGWDEINAATDAELGRVWVTRYDRLAVRGRGSQLSGPMRGTLSDWHGEAAEGSEHCCYSAATVRYGTELLVNRAIGSRRVPEAGEGEPTPAAAVVTQIDDTVSQARYDVIASTENRSLEVQTDGQAEAWARFLVTNGADPELRVDSVTLAPYGSPAAWPAVAATDIGDRWAFRLHPEVGPTVKRGLGVLGIEHTITPDSWETIITTVDAPEPTEGNPSGWFIVGESEVDSGDLLFPRSTVLEYAGFG